MKSLGSQPLGSFIFTALLSVILTASPASAAALDCAQPISTGSGPVASDCLFILGAVVGSQTCSPECICAPSGTLPPKATDALICLADATGQSVTLDCPCDDEPPPPPPGGLGDYVGFVTASFSRSIVPGFIPGVPATINESMDVSGVFATVTLPGIPDITVTTEMVSGCTVVTTELTNTFDQNDLPTIDNLDPGAPGKADNGSTELDLLRMVSEGAESFEPAGDPASSGYGPSQTVMFSWPGGSDINSFSGSVQVPSEIKITSPDITSANFDVVPGQPVAFEWMPGSDQDGKLDIVLATSILEFAQGSGDEVTIDSTTVTATCPFTDSNGSGTVTGAVTSKLQSSVSFPLIYTKTFSAERGDFKEISVTGSGIGSGKKVFMSGTTSVSRSLTSGFSFPLRKD
jgi:hypothetical protein